MTQRNENRKGFKKTEVGWIPEGWEVKPLGLFGSFFKGKGISNSEKTETGFPCVTYGEIYTKHDFIIKDFKSFISEETAKTSQKIKKNDILFAGSGETLDEIGKCIANIKNVEAYAGGDIIIFRPRGNNCIYLSFSLNSNLIARSRRKLGQGYSVVHIYSNGLKKLNVPLPPLPEQKKIAEILSTWDRAIEQVRRLIDAKKRLKKGMMQQLLTGRKRFMGFTSKVKREKVSFYDYPYDWTHPRIAEVAKEITIRNSSNKKMTVVSCSKYQGFVDSLEYFRKKVYSDNTLNYKVVKRNQFGFPSNHIEEGSIGLLSHVDIGIVSPIYTIFETDPNKVWPHYLYSLFKTETYRHIFSISTNASVDRRGSLRWKEFGKIRVPLPLLNEQEKISAYFSLCDHETHILQKRETRFQNAKKSLMQKLLTGEVRVST